MRERPNVYETGSLEVIRTSFGPLELAIELHEVSSVLNSEEAKGLELLDPAQQLGLRPIGRGHVGFVEPEFGPPVGVRLGDVRGFEKWSPRNILALPDWIADFLPDVLKRACGHDEYGEIVWLLDIVKLTEKYG